jgi:hypothetical protein
MNRNENQDTIINTKEQDQPYNQAYNFENPAHHINISYRNPRQNNIISNCRRCHDYVSSYKRQISFQGTAVKRLNTSLMSSTQDKEKTSSGYRKETQSLPKYYKGTSSSLQPQSIPSIPYTTLASITFKNPRPKQHKQRRSCQDSRLRESPKE